ncbi:MAG: hypothetical protein JO167_03290 [Alphaproteobacteria bacterium]|nr:hypothetical protein [Alphaproteobacteria bacterium]
MTITMDAPRARMNAEHRFFMTMILVMEASLLFGFARTVILRPLFPGFPSPPEGFFYHAHGALFFGWMTLLLVQGSLISTRNTALHMRLGLVSFALVPLMIAVGVFGSLLAARRPGGFIGVPVPPLQFLATLFGDMVMFGLFAGLAIWFRRDVQAHKRLIILATTVLMDPTIGRWPIAALAQIPNYSFWGKLLLFLVPLAIWDLVSRKRLHWATILGAAVIIPEGLLRDPISATPQWLAFAKWATGLLG